MQVRASSTPGVGNVLVFGADHIYRMDPRQMVEQHIESGTGVVTAFRTSSLNRSACSASASCGKRSSMPPVYSETAPA